MQAHAVSGIQRGGYGQKNAAMGGASIAMPFDAMAAANNPAGMAFVPTMVNFNLTVLDQRSQSNYALPGNSLNSDIRAIAPEAGLNYVLDSKWTLGLTVAGHGAMVDYERPMLPFPGAPNAKAALKIAEIIPGFTYRPLPNLALGAGLNLVYMTLDAQGQFVPIPVAPGAALLPAHGRQSATGEGVTLGALWQATPEVWLGATYKSRTRMGRLGDYGNDLLALSAGKIDVPAQYGVGISWHPRPDLSFALDLMQIQWSRIDVLKDPAGFYWKDQNVRRFGVRYSMNANWTLLAGYSRSQQQMRSSNVAQNVLIPALSTMAYTLGTSYRLSDRSEIGVTLEVNPAQRLTGTGPSAGTDLSNRVRVLTLGYQFAF